MVVELSISDKNFYISTEDIQLLVDYKWHLFFNKITASIILEVGVKKQEEKSLCIG